jgi:polar amino acid transport system substrate-binding protein
MLRLAIVFSGLLVLVLTSCTMATEISPTVRSELTPTGKLRVGINHGNTLLVTTMAPEPRGVAPDVARELARRLGVPVEFVPYDSAGKLGDGVRTGAWDVAFLGAEPQRAAEIAFTAAYLEIPATYIVPAGSPIRSVAEVDREGVRIAVPEQAAYGLYLRRSVKHARLVLTKSSDAAVEAFIADKLEALAGLRPRLLTDVAKLPGARVLDGQFTGVQQAIGTAKSRAAAAEYLRAFVEEIKASGLVAEAISRSGVAGVSVAPPASP